MTYATITTTRECLDKFQAETQKQAKPSLLRYFRLFKKLGK